MTALGSRRHSPASSVSSTTTPTSPNFRAHSYASSYAEPRQSSVSLSSVNTISHPLPPTPPLYHAPPNISFPSYLRSWGPSEITTFLGVYKCAHYAGIFHRNDIDGKVLLDLDMAALKEMGVAKVGERVKLLGGIKELRKRATAPRVELRVNGTATPPLVSPVQRLAAPSNGTRRLHTTRPPPLDLQPHVPSRPLPQAYSRIPPRPTLSTQNSSTTVTPSSVPAPAPRSNLRAPPPRRSPSPNTDASSFVDRPLPPPPGQQSSAAEYASSITQSRNHRKAPSITRPAVAPHPFAARNDERKTSPQESSLGSAKRPFVVGSGVMVTSKSSSSGERRKPPSDAQVPLEDIRRQVVRFINKEDGTTRTVNVASCSSGVEVLERVLKKFGKWGTGMSTDESDEDGDRLEVDGWGVYADSDPDPEAIPLSEANLLGICMSHRDGSAIRERGLVLRRTRKQKNRKNMEVFFGEPPPAVTSPTSPIYHGPRLGFSPSRDEGTAHKSKKMNRASTVSIMSGLGVPMGDVPPSPSTLRSPSSGSFLATKGRKMYNFFGHRPPSELVITHLPEYFPSAKKRDLEKTFRQSMMRAGPRRGSIAPSESKMSLDIPTASPPRRTRPVSSRKIASPPPASIPEETEIPRVSVSTDTSVRLLPPFEPTRESLNDTVQFNGRPKSTLMMRRGSAGSTKSRLSVMSQLRRNRDRSDTASLLTVDEITAEVEHRRASTITFDESDEEEEIVAPATDPGPVPLDESGDDASDDEDDDDDDDEEEDEEEEEEDDEHGRAFTSTGSARIIKWIKGALIGAGSFGSVYLGMDAHSGLLMAVKQVELPTGSARNEERKRSMVSALEREIELLKELQHENIVQYLDSSADGNHLNIFLEYVPGGSVAALLSNYGAFEEALVRNFVRQILTGLNYLHEREIIHRDIKGANILVDNKGGIKISDFGISKKVESSESTMSAMADLSRPHDWHASEPAIIARLGLLDGAGDREADELHYQSGYMERGLSRRRDAHRHASMGRPRSDASDVQAGLIGSFARPVLPGDISPDAADLLRKTFEIDYAARPTAAQLLEHPFIATKHAPGISAAQARATMSAANAQRGAMMGGMQSLSALAAV